MPEQHPGIEKHHSTRGRVVADDSTCHRFTGEGADMDERTIIERLGLLPTAAVSDVLDRLGLPGSLLGIQRQTTGKGGARRAFTVRYEPIDEDRGGTVGDFLDDVRPGDVVVIDNQGRVDCTVWGGIMSRVAAGRGVAGTVINGTCRDVASAEVAGYPVWRSPASAAPARTGCGAWRCRSLSRSTGSRSRPATTYSPT